MEKIKGYRTMLGLSQSDLAIKLGLSSTGYRLKESGEREFTKSEIDKILALINEKYPNLKYEDIFLK